ncbi:MFS transporter [Sphingobacterium oryzagri]|uniref:MFS transporter n=1 Tax=Sphingobacterium oryzagri TaxID=3025669 RepID=A0ABY7WF80_9SPHI|nr:MFS transporter [Sphingobacterium sp. KACC 22765]WDF67560.1 MFS transporter [Sphingobacterium sp. KACC 22765]
MVNWKTNLYTCWLGCFFTGIAISMVLPFLPLLVMKLGVNDNETLWSGLVFSITFLVSAIATPFWGKLSDRYGRKVMLLRASLGMSIVIFCQAFVSDVWQLLALRGIMGITSGYIPTAIALIGSQIPAERSGWGLSVLSTAQISGVLIGPLLGGFIADTVNISAVFISTSVLLIGSFFISMFLIKEDKQQAILPKEKEKTRVSWTKQVSSVRLIIALLFASMLIQVINSSINPILLLYVKKLDPLLDNLAFTSGVISAAPGFSALFAAPVLGKLGDRLGIPKILFAALLFTAVILFITFFATSVVQLGFLRFLLGFGEGALFPCIQSLLLQHTDRSIYGTVFGYNQSSIYIGNIVGPLIGSYIAMLFDFNYIFLIVAVLLIINAVNIYLAQRGVLDKANSPASS